MDIVNKKSLIFFSFIFYACFFALPARASYTVEIPLPGLPGTISDPGQYVRYLFIFGLALAGFLAVAAIAYGGVKYMLAGASIGSTQDAKDTILGALIGIGFLLGSYLLLYTIDPTLTNLSPRVPPAVNIAAPESAGPRYGISTTTNTRTEYYDSSAPAYNTREKCEAIGRSAYGDRFIGVSFGNGNCSIVIKLK